MTPFIPLTVSEQVAEHLRREIRIGKLTGLMPGVLKLEAEMGVNRKTVESALQILEREGLIQAQGAGKRRLIMPLQKRSQNNLRIAIFHFELQDIGTEHMLLMEHQLQLSGHIVFRTPVTLTQLGMNLNKISQVIRTLEADAWIVTSASQEVLKWFHSENIPVLAVFGRRRGLPIASVGPDKKPAYREITKLLISLGHRRIVWLTRELRRLPTPGEAEQSFFDEMLAHGITPSNYNLPHWEETVDGLNNCLQSLFQLTPPTAIIADEAQFYFATQNFLNSRKISVPGDVSLICTDGDLYFKWCKPTVAHIQWNHQQLVKRVLKWANNIKLGKPDKTHTFIPAEFIPGGTIGWVKK